MGSFKSKENMYQREDMQYCVTLAIYALSVFMCWKRNPEETFCNSENFNYAGDSKTGK